MKIFGLGDMVTVNGKTGTVCYITKQGITLQDGPKHKSVVKREIVDAEFDSGNLTVHGKEL